MSLVATLDVALRGQTGDLDTKLDRSGKAVQLFGQKVAAWAGQAMGALQGGLARFGGMVQSWTSDLAKLGVAAGRLGMTTEALGGLQHAAALAGIEAEDLNSRMAKFARMMSTAGMGEGGALQALNQLGLDAAQLKDLAPEEQLFRVADALKETGTAGDKVRILNELMGKGADRLLPTLLKGGEELKRLTREAGMIGPTDAGSVAQAQASVAAWRELSAVLQGVKRTIGAVLAPLLTEGSKSITAVIKPIAMFAVQNVDFLRALTGAGMELMRVMLTVMNPFELLKNLIEGIGTAISQAFGGESISLSIGSWRDTALEGILYVTAAIKNIKATFMWVFVEAAKGVIWLVNRMIDGLNWVLKKVGIGEIGNIETPKLDALVQQYRDFFGNEVARMKDELMPRGKPMEKGKEIESVGRKPAAIEAGSKEAFSILFGQKSAQDKAYAVANQTLAENKKMRALLEKIANKRFGAGIKKAQL